MDPPTVAAALAVLVTLFVARHRLAQRLGRWARRVGARRIGRRMARYARGPAMLR